MANTRPTTLSETFTTPPGIAQYPRLNEPDDRWGESKFTVNLVFNDSEIQEFARKLRAHYEACIKHEGGKRKAPFPLKPLVDRDTGEEVPGKSVLKLAMKAHVKTKRGKEWDQRPTIVDAKKNPWPKNGPIIGGGSRLRCIFDAVSYDSPSVGAGCSIRLKAVQVLDLEEFVPNKTIAGFEEEEGYEAQAADDDFTSTSTPEVGADHGDF